MNRPLTNPVNNFILLLSLVVTFVSSDGPFMLLYASLFQCLGYGETITDFPGNSNDSWTIFLQFPLLSFLDTARRDVLLNNISQLIINGSDNRLNDTFDGSMICVGRYEAYRLSYYEES